MADCKICVKFDDCPWQSDPDAMCSGFRQRPMTNGDHIRSMSDKELANLFANSVDCLYCSVRSDWCQESELACKRNWLDWLKEEVSE